MNGPSFDPRYAKTRKGRIAELEAELEDALREIARLRAIIESLKTTSIRGET